MQEELRDIHLPDPISWWPLAPGWYALALLIVLILLISGWWLYRLRHPSIKKSAMRELVRIESEYDEHSNTQQLCADISILLRRVAISYGSREHEAGITGEAWLKHLNGLCVQPIFSKKMSGFLLYAPYQQSPDIPVADFLAACNQWVEQLPRSKRR